MLEELSIRHFAIIDDMRIRFQKGLTVLSGETGAGKSIIINAVNLLLGSRATSKMVRTGEKAAELEARFSLPDDADSTRVMQQLGFDPEQGLHVKRIISANNRHRVLINGTASTMQNLTAITSRLASISGQHAHQLLLDEHQHLLILDQFGGLRDMRRSVGRCVADIQKALGELETLNRRQDRREELRDLLTFQKQEIESAGIAPGEDAALEQQRRRLKNLETLIETVRGAVDTLYDSTDALAGKLYAVHQDIEKARAIDADLGPVGDRLNEAGVLVEDIAADLRRYAGGLEDDPAALADIEERLDLLNRLKRKYGGSLPAIQAHLEKATQDLAAMESLESAVAATEAELRRLHQEAGDIARQLSDERRRWARRLADRIAEELDELEMKGVEVDIQIDPVPADPHLSSYLRLDDRALTPSGIDRAAIMISPNVGEVLKPLAGIASGGELSRVVLAIKAILARSESVESVVFDEVDAGIGGRVAEMVGRKLKRLAEFHQVLCITHLPQIAKFGDHHYGIVKRVDGGRTRTVISPLNDAQRIDEIARMLGGADITRTTRAHASELLGLSK